MKSSPDLDQSHKGIIRGATVDGVVFCTPSGDMETAESRKRQDDAHLKALEQYWYQRGFEEGQSKGAEEGLKRGKEDGSRKGFQEGFDKGRAEGLIEGSEAGIQQGTKEAQQELEETLALLRTYVDAVVKQQEGLISKAHAECIPFCLAVCEQILRRELSHKESYTKLLDSVLQYASVITKNQQVNLFVAEEDHVFLSDGLHQLKIEGGLAERLHVSVDPNLLRGDCRLETELGLVNFDIKRQLDNLEKRLLELSEGESDDQGKECVDGAQARQGDTASS